MRALLADQLAHLADRTHTRIVDEGNGVESLRMSVDATRLARA